jgi:UDP-N-acetylmuramoylalanine--D-glutamate ligase
VRFSELDGASIGVWGAGREIVSFADQLARRLPAARIAVAAFDEPPAGDVLARLRSPSARVAIGAEGGAALAECEVVVRSPGVSVHRPELEGLREAGVPVTTATALWLAERGGAGVIGVTGTKGKSTTAALIHHLADGAGGDMALAGNIGVPALDLLDDDPARAAVVELSSYQIADLEVGPQVAVFTNLFREHIDWHGSEELYRAEKLRLLDLPGVQVCVLNAREPGLAHLSPLATVRRYAEPGGWDVLDGGLALRGEPMISAAELPLPGEHNALNLCAALTAVEVFGLHPSLPGGLAGFQGLPHRLQSVCERGGVLWVNDSISTTPESALAALASFPGRELVLIAGGQDRGQDFAELARALAGRGAALVSVPATGPRLRAAAIEAGVGQDRARSAPGMQGAVALAASLARPGAVVLLSPAAPSYDRYRDFVERGELFSSLARVLPGTP